MKVILSYPYSGALYWWFNDERQFPMPKRPTHPYYAQLFGDVDRHLDVALTCALVYEEFVIPAADAAYPGLGDLRHFSPGDFGLEVSEWDPVQVAWNIASTVEETYQEDPELRELLAQEDKAEARMEMMYAAADALLAAEYEAPVLCSDGRRAVARRLIELGLVPVGANVAAQFAQGAGAADVVESYSEVTGLTFGADGLRQFLDLKEMSPLREYAQSFQQALADPGGASLDDFYEAIAGAMESKDLAEHVRGAFEATGHVMSIVGLIPVVNTVANLGELGSDAAAAAAEGRAESLSWFELSQAVAGARTRANLEAELRRRDLRS